MLENWNVSEVQSIDAGKAVHEEAYDGEHYMSAEGAEKYPGQILSSDSTNTKSIESLRDNAIGMQNKIVQIQDTISADKYHFEVAVVLRNS